MLSVITAWWASLSGYYSVFQIWSILSLIWPPALLFALSFCKRKSVCLGVGGLAMVSHLLIVILAVLGILKENLDNNDIMLLWRTLLF